MKNLKTSHVPQLGLVLYIFVKIFKIYLMRQQDVTKLTGFLPKILYSRVYFRSQKKGKAKISYNFICVNLLFCSGCLLGWHSNGHIRNEQQLRLEQGNQNNNINFYIKTEQEDRDRMKKPSPSWHYGRHCKCSLCYLYVVSSCIQSSASCAIQCKNYTPVMAIF